MITADIVSKSKKWTGYEAFVDEACQKIIPLTSLKKLLNKDVLIELSISLVLDKEMQKINFDHRGQNKPTNVLSFPALDSVPSKSSYVFLGDVIIALETVTKEALAQKKTFENHLTHMILHSILHLMGFDHENDEMAEVMETLEIKILKKLQINNPYN